MAISATAPVRCSTTIHALRSASVGNGDGGHAGVAGHYRKLVYITMPGVEPMESDRLYARAHAVSFGLEYVEMEGSLALLKQMAEGDWSGDVLMVSPGELITLDMMMSNQRAKREDDAAQPGVSSVP